ncbi:hypothetical protein MMC15_000866 [Xylographa vitiligo]|nr:hypothetical protein [Xylographa vitiligo]
MINSTLYLTHALSNTSHVVQSNLTTNLEECRQRVPLLHDWNHNGVSCFALALTIIVLICTLVALDLDLETKHKDHEMPKPLKEDSLQGRNYREECFVVVCGTIVVSWACTYLLMLVLQFSLCSLGDAAWGIAMVANVLAWCQLPLGLTVSVNLGRDVWAGKRIPDPQRMPSSVIYALPVLVPVLVPVLGSGYLFLRLIKGARSLVDHRRRHVDRKVGVEATDGGRSDGMLLPKHAEVDEAGDGQERAAAAAGAWC